MKRTSQIFPSPAPWHIKDESIEAALFATNCTRPEKPNGEEDPHTTGLSKISLYSPPQPETRCVC